ncbi:MAG: hypothetical protein MJ184_06995, partial [Treponema sp.]|uniref:hypothetical protein n=1 Tax=Treponema sp. TaxID=166 RepID=UPI00298EA6C3
FKSFLFALVIGLFASCQNPSSGGSSVSFSSGWWKFATDNSTVYLNYDNSKNIIRAGSPDQEYAASIVENMNKGESFSWDMCLKNATDARMIFEKVEFANLPEWAKKITQANISILYGEYRFDESITAEGIFYEEGPLTFYRFILGKRVDTYSNSYMCDSSKMYSFPWEILDNGNIHMTFWGKSVDTKFSFDGKKVIFEDFLGQKNVSATKIK